MSQMEDLLKFDYKEISSCISLFLVLQEYSKDVLLADKFQL